MTVEESASNKDQPGARKTGGGAAGLDSISGFEHSGLESERFGLRVFRARGSAADGTLASAIVENDCDVAIVRSRAGNVELRLELERTGFTVLHADTLVYYDCDLAHLESKPARSGNFKVRKATRRDEPELAALVKRVFLDYPSHYAANDLFRPELVLAGYVEWATNFIGGSGRQVLLAQSASQIVGFLTFEEREDCTEIVLNGVDPLWQGRGVYGDLLRAVLDRGRESGVSHVLISTQVNNYSVQRAWHREGFRLSAAYDTFHINSMLHAGTEIVVLRIPIQNGIVDLNVLSILTALKAQAPALAADLSRLEVAHLVARIARGEHRVAVRMHVDSSGANRYVGVIRDPLGGAVGILSAYSSYRLLEQTE